MRACDCIVLKEDKVDWVGKGGGDKDVLYVSASCQDVQVSRCTHRNQDSMKRREAKLHAVKVSRTLPNITPHCRITVPNTTDFFLSMQL